MCFLTLFHLLLSLCWLLSSRNGLFFFCLVFLTFSRVFSDFATISFLRFACYGTVWSILIILGVNHIRQNRINYIALAAFQHLFYGALICYQGLCPSVVPVREKKEKGHFIAFQLNAPPYVFIFHYISSQSAKAFSAEDYWNPEFVFGCPCHVFPVHWTE